MFAQSLHALQLLSIATRCLPQEQNMSANCLAGKTLETFQLQWLFSLVTMETTVRSESGHAKATLTARAHQACTKSWILLDHCTKFTVILIVMAPGRCFSLSALRIDVLMRLENLCIKTLPKVKMLCRGRPID